MMLAKMPDTSFAPLTQRHGYTDEEKENIQKAVRLLETSHGVVDMPQMREEFCDWLEAKRQLALAVADYVLAMQMEMFGQRLDRQQKDDGIAHLSKSDD